MKFNTIKKKELLRFLVGGGSAVIVDFLMYKGFMIIGIDRNISKAFSFICGSIIGFTINKFWTFGSSHFLKKEVFKYIVLYSFTALINALVNKFVLSFCSIEMLGFLSATGVSTVLNFLGQKYFVFQK